MHGTLPYLGLVAVTAVACSDRSTGTAAGDQLADFAGSWDGHIELSRFDDRSDRVRLTLDAAGQGTLRLGDRELFPAATNPDVAYPDQNFLSPGYWRSGFSYPVYRTRAGDGRLRLVIDPGDLYRGWCRLQRPIARNANLNREGPRSQIYGCTNPWDKRETSPGICEEVDPATNQGHPVDCVKEQLCLTNSCFDPMIPTPGAGLGPGPCPPPPGSACVCDANACDFSPLATDATDSLDAELDPGTGKLMGSLAFDLAITVRLTRH